MLVHVFSGVRDDVEVASVVVCVAALCVDSVGVIDLATRVAFVGCGDVVGVVVFVAGGIFDILGGTATDVVGSDVVGYDDDVVVVVVGGVCVVDYSCDVAGGCCWRCCH